MKLHLFKRYVNGDMKYLGTVIPEDDDLEGGWTTLRDIALRKCRSYKGKWIVIIDYGGTWEALFYDRGLPSHPLGKLSSIKALISSFDYDKLTKALKEVGLHG